MQTLPATEKMGAPGSSPDMTFFTIEVGSRGPFQVTVNEQDVERWSRIYDDHNPWYTGDSPAGGPIAPPSILYYPSQMFLGRYLIGKSENAKLPGGFARYSLENVAPIPVGQPLLITGGVTDKFARRGRGYVRYELQATCNGQVVQRHWKNWAFGLTEEEAAQYPEKSSDPREDIRGEVIETIGPLGYDVLLSRMADLEGPGERNAHTDVEIAKAGGGPGPLAQGAISFGLISRLLTDTYGIGYLAGGSLDVRFVDRVYAGEVLTAKGEVLSKEGGVARLVVWAENSKGVKVTAGTASARIEG